MVYVIVVGMLWFMSKWWERCGLCQSGGNVVVYVKVVGMS